MAGSLVETGKGCSNNEALMGFSITENDIMLREQSVKFRAATNNDIGFMSGVLCDAALASGVRIPVNDLASYPDTFQYIAGFPYGSDVGVIAETNEGHLVGAAWVRLLPTDAHAVNKHLPELTMGVIAAYRCMGVGKHMMDELYKAAFAKGIFEISLGVHKDNLAAITLYKKQKWVEDGTFMEYSMMSKKIAR